MLGHLDVIVRTLRSSSVTLQLSFIFVENYYTDCSVLAYIAVSLVIHYSFTIIPPFNRDYMTLQYTELYNLINISDYLEVLFFLWYT